MVTCSRCILPDSYPGIHLNSEGVCNHCLSHRKWEYRGEEELARLLSRFRGRGRRYDCVVGVSGGRDSSYALNYLVKHSGLRVTAYTADSGYIPQIAKDNMARITEALGVELYVDRHDLLRTCFTANARAWFHKPSAAMISMMCCGCKLGGSRGVLRYAKKNDIPLVVMNIETPAETGLLKRSLLADNPWGRAGGRRRGLSMLLGLAYELASNPRYLASPKAVYVNVAEYLYFFYYRLMQRSLYPRQTLLLDLYRYVEWDENTILTTIQNELGWRKDPEVESSWRFDCQLSFLKNHLLQAMVGVTEKDDSLSAMVREGMLSRDQALERVRVENTVPDRRLREVVESLGIGDVDIAGVLGRPGQQGAEPEPEEGRRHAGEQLPPTRAPAE